MWVAGRAEYAYMVLPSGAGEQGRGGETSTKVAVVFSRMDGDGAAERRRAAERSGDTLLAAQRGGAQAMVLVYY